MKNEQFSEANLYRELADKHQMIDAYVLIKCIFETLGQDCFDGEIIDLGCGPAGMIIELEKYLSPPVHYTGVDRSEAMIAAARKEHRNYQFVLADIVEYTQHLSPQTKPAFISNACLHWLDTEQLQKLFQNVWAALTDKGYFSFRMSLSKNGQSIKDEIKRTLSAIGVSQNANFATPYRYEDIEQHLEKTGFGILYKEEILRKKLMPIDTIVQWVKTTQSISFASSEQQDAFYTSLTASLVKSKPSFDKHQGIFMCQKNVTLMSKS